MILADILVVTTVLVPVWAFLIWKWDYFRGWPTFLIVQGFLGFLTIWSGILPPDIPKVTSWIAHYSGALFLFNFILAYKWGLDRFNRILAVGAWSVFIVADWWEIPVFVYGFLGSFNGIYSSWSGTWADQIHHIYVILSIFLFIGVARPQMARWILAGVGILGTTSSFLALLPGIPWGLSLARTGPLLAFGILLGSMSFPSLGRQGGRHDLGFLHCLGWGKLLKRVTSERPLKKKGSVDRILSARGDLFITSASAMSGREKPLGACINYLKTEIGKNDPDDRRDQDPRPGDDDPGDADPDATTKDGRPHSENNVVGRRH